MLGSRANDLAQHDLYGLSDFMDCYWNTVDSECSEYDSHRHQKAGSLISLARPHKWREETPPEQQGTISIECHTTTYDHPYGNLAHAG